MYYGIALVRLVINPLGDNGMFRCSFPCEIGCSLICIRMNKSWAQKIEPLNNNLP
jgi:hypothetical protein